MIYSTNKQDQIDAAILEKVKEAQHYGQSSDRLPAVYKARVSPRRVYIGWNYQPKGTKVGDTFKPIHPNDFIESPEVVWIHPEQ